MTKRRPTATTAFGAGRRESHDASEFYSRFRPPEISNADELGPVPALPDPPCIVGDSRDMHRLPDNSVALVVTSPPYFVGKEYEVAVTAGADDRVPTSYLDYLEMLRDVFAECARVLEPGGRIAINVANLGRKPYRSLAADVVRILQDDLGLLLRGEIVWQKAEGATGSVAWGSFRKATNPVLRDITERVIVASKGRFDRARSVADRKAEGRPHRTTISTDEFMEATLDVWRIDSESARRVQHPAPFPIELPRRLIDLYTYEGDLVLDPFLGSGTTLVAAARTGRRGVGYDLDPEYVEIAAQRYRAELARPRYTETAAEQMPFELIAPEFRVEAFTAKATSAGKKAADLAREALEKAGFGIVAEAPKLRGAGVQFAFIVEDAASDHRYHVDIAGAFTTVRPGMVRTDVLWKTIGKAHVLAAREPGARLLVMTSHLPRRGTPGWQALRTVGPWSIFDVIEMFDPAAVARLEAYGSGASEPLPGFWDEADLERSDLF
jgi:DNA modification methylase